MQLLEFFRRVAVTGQATVEAAANFSLPFGIILPGPPAKILGKLQPLFGSQRVHRLLEFSNAHGPITPVSDEFSRAFQNSNFTSPSRRAISPSTRCSSAASLAMKVTLKRR